MTLLEINQLTRSFERNNEKIYPIKELDFTLNKKDFSVIMGRSGTGKTTLLNLMALFLKPDQGEILFKGKELSRLSDVEASKYRNEHLGYLTQSPATIPSLNVLESILLPYSLNDLEFDVEERAFEIMERLEISHLKDSWVRNLSGGEKKRVCIARTLINQPKILILDEPTSDLDDQTANKLRDFLVELNDGGMTILTVTHDNEFRDMGKVFQLKEGKLE